MNVEDDTVVFVIDKGARFHCTSAPSPEPCHSTPHSAIYPLLYQALSEQPLTIEDDSLTQCGNTISLCLEVQSNKELNGVSLSRQPTLC